MKFEKPKIVESVNSYIVYIFSKRKCMQRKSLHRQYHCSIFEWGFIQFTYTGYQPLYDIIQDPFS